MKATFPFFALAIAVTGCNARRDKLPHAPQTGEGTWFSLIQSRVIQPHCITCHAGPGSKGGIDLTSYKAVLATSVIPGKPDQSKFYTEIDSGDMPYQKPRLPQQDIDLVRTWIADGAPEVKGQKPEPTPGAKVAYETLQMGLFNTRCVSCHNPVKKKGLVDLTSFEALMASPGKKAKPINLENPEQSGLYVELIGDKMPPKPRPLNDLEKTALNTWITNGALEETPGTVLPGPNEPNPPQPNYEWLYKNVFDRRCGSCHHGEPFNVGKVDFTTYATLMESSNFIPPVNPGIPESSSIYIQVTEGRMPPPRKTVTPEEIESVLNWIKQGALKE